MHMGSKLSLRGSISIVVLIVILFGILFGINQQSVSNEIDVICEAKSTQDLDYMMTYIDKELSQAEQATKTLAASVFKGGDYVPSTEEIFEFQELFLKANPNLSSVMVGFEPRVIEESKGKNISGQLVVNNEGGGMLHYQLDSMPGISDFRTLDWYNIAIHRELRRWCKPFLSPIGRYAISSYSVPLYNRHKHLVGVVGVNMRISRFDSILTSLKPYPNAIPAVVLNQDLTYILHPIKDFVLNMTLKSELESIGEEASDEFLTQLAARKTGKETVTWSGRKQTIYYAPVEKAECSVMLTIDDKTARQAIDPEAGYRKKISLGGLAILTLYLCFLYIRGRRKQNKEEEAQARSAE